MTFLDATDPIALFGAWFDETNDSEVKLPEAMSLSTIDPDGTVASRMVLLKDFDAAGFVFYTNFESRKGRALVKNPVAALCFHWDHIHRQVRIEGHAEIVSDAEADAYFASRPRGAQIGAWASKQSDRIAAPGELEQRIAAFTEKFADQPVPRPPHWSGFRIVPKKIEFWQGRVDRLHDRLVFATHAGGWTSERIYP
jgi:pyridoxamine 5'-phosphate oxidase